MRNDVLGAMVREIFLQAEYLQGESIHTIYFGGGTPSMLTREELSAFLNTIQKVHDVAHDAEITLEANPDDVNANTLVGWKEAGINRLSIGIQAFQDSLLSAWNRSHRSEQGVQALDMALEAGFENITADLIYGGAGLTDEDWAMNIDQLTSRRIPHISSYALTVENGTALFHQVEKGKVNAPDDDQANRQYAFLQNELMARGYHQYEVSNFSLEGFASMHNCSYWKGEKYLGIGPSAHSYDQRSRQWNIAHNIKYAAALTEGRVPYEKEVLTVEQQYNEIVMTGLRTSAGIDLDRIQRLGHDLLARLEHELSLIRQRPGYEDALHYTPSGHPALHKDFLFFADGIASDLFITATEKD